MLQIEGLLRQLHSSGVNFILLGGVAAAAHGSSQVTYDLDVCYERTDENIERLAAALKGLNPKLRGAPENLPFRWDAQTIKAGLNFTLTTQFGDLDFLGEVAGLGGYDQAMEYSETLDLMGMKCRVLTLEGLIKAKEAAGREKDILHLKELKALLEIRDKK